MDRKTGQRTLLTSLLLSAPGPLVVGLGLSVGRSSTQWADFIRRSAELAAIFVSWVLYRTLYRNGEPEPDHQARLEARANRTVGIAMVLSGSAMMVIALGSSDADKGNVIPGLIIATLGVITNTWFWLRYRQLDRRQSDGILAAQSKLYRAKALVDGCVMAALGVIAAAPGTQAARVMDLGGSIAVALYLVVNGVMILKGKETVTGSVRES